jgi:ADP-heptose:LPS heptosyltransferase
MVMDVKRWPAANFAALANRFSLPVVLIGGKGDEALVAAVKQDLSVPAETFVGALSFGEIAALARGAKLYIGNDTGLTHLAAAAGAKTVMILGPSDPSRYSPYAQDALSLWQPTSIPDAGVTAGAPPDWGWQRDGISVDSAEAQIRAWLGENSKVE